MSSEPYFGASGLALTVDSPFVPVLKRATIAPAQEATMSVRSVLWITCIPLVARTVAGTNCNAWAPKQAARSRDEVLAALTVRCFRSHGPASRQDLMGWTGLSNSDVKHGVAALVHEIIKFDFDDKGPWMIASLRGDLAPRPEKAHPPDLALAGFDEFMLGFKDRAVAVAAMRKDFDAAFEQYARTLGLGAGVRWAA